MVGIRDVQAARDRLQGKVRITPVRPSFGLSQLAQGEVWLKCEHEQDTGAFKLRGASNAVARLGGDVAGVTTASTGNHGRAVAHAARRHGLRAIICVSRLVPANKLRAIEEQGAEARVIGESQDEAFLEAHRLQREEGFALVPPFDDADVIAGQGTLGLELLDQIPNAATLAIPVSGGGLLSGVALAARTRRPGIRIIGISMQRGAAMAASLQAGHPVEVPELETLADSLGGGIGLGNRLTFAMTQRLMDRMILLSEDEIAAGIRYLWQHEGEMVEGAGAVGVAAILSGKLRAEGGPLIVLVTGRNIDPALHAAVVAAEGPWTRS